MQRYYNLVQVMDGKITSLKTTLNSILRSDDTPKKRKEALENLKN